MSDFYLVKLEEFFRDRSTLVAKGEVSPFNGCEVLSLRLFARWLQEHAGGPPDSPEYLGAVGPT